MRFPGGEKSDNYLWSIPPYTSSNPRFARTGSCEWPSNDPRFAMTDYKTPKGSNLDFDEFMTMCKSVGGEPLIVVPYDCMYKAIPAGCTGTIPTKAQLLTNAEEWVRYANLIKHYNIKYWMIGNESYNTSAANGHATAAQYRDDIVQFSQRMKAVDPTIKIIANGDNQNWWSIVLPTAAPHIDFLGVSNYPVWQFNGGYTHYKNNSTDLMGVVNDATSAINQYAPTAHKSRIRVITTELNSMDWSGAWPNNNDLGHALVTFEMIGEHLKNPKVEAALLWNTRWINSLTNPSDLYDAIDKNGRPEANGKALTIWGKNMLKKMVATTSTTKIRTFASYDPVSQELNVFLLNKETTSMPANLSWTNYLTKGKMERWEFKGSSPADVNPTWASVSTENFSATSKSLQLPPNSVTMIKLKKSAIDLVSTSSTVSMKTPILVWHSEGGGGNRESSAGNGGTYIIEKSNDGLNFTQVGSVAVTSSKEYSFTDSEAESTGVAYYRVSLVEGDEITETSSIAKINLTREMSLQLYPNPAHTTVTLEIAASENIPVKVEVFQPDGKRIYSKSHFTENDKIDLNVDIWPQGMYIIKAEAGNKSFVEKLLVN
jgi:hypothetical protein